MPLLRAEEETKRRWPLGVLRTLEILFWLTLVMLVWIGASGGREFQDGTLKLSVTSSRNPSTLLVVLLVLILWGRGGLRPFLDRTISVFRSSTWAGKLGLVVASIGAVLTIPDYGRIPTAFGNALTARRHVQTNEGSRHVESLVARVASRESAQPVAVYIRDDDPRGHLASFYCYPRLLLMEPAMRRWTMTARVNRLWAPRYADPAWVIEGAADIDLPYPERIFRETDESPAIRESREWARDLGVDLIEVFGPLDRGSRGEAPDRKWLGYPELERLDRGSSPSTFVPVQSYTGLANVPPSSHALWCDLDGDAFPDLSFEPWNGGAPIRLLNLEGAGFAVSQATPRSVTQGDPLTALLGLPSSLEARGEPEVGIQVAWGDLNNDGVLDAYLFSADAQTSNLLLWGTESGSFIPARAAVGLAVQGVSTSCDFADYDGDGDLDVYLSRYEGDLLLANEGYRFVDVTREAGLETRSGRSTARFLDADSNGRMDLMVCDTRVGFVQKQTIRLWRNAGETFESVPETMGIDRIMATSEEIALADYDQDGIVDILLGGGSDPFHLTSPDLLTSWGSLGSWLRVSLDGGDAPRPYGVRIRLPSGKLLSRRSGQLAPGDGHDLPIGLGSVDYIREVVVDTPRGIHRVQGVPVDATLHIPDGTRYIGSHPSALLGRVRTFDLEAAWNRAQALLGESAFIPAAKGEDAALIALHERVLADALTFEIAQSTEIDESEWLAAKRAHASSLVLPRRWRFEHVAFRAIGHSRWEPADVAERLAAIMQASDWAGLEPLWEIGARPFSGHMSEQPGFAAYRHTGWIAEDEMERRFGDLTEELKDLAVGEVHGPSSQDGQPWTTVTRLVEVQAGGLLDASWVDHGIRSRALRKKLEAALTDVAGGDASDLVASLARTARKRGFEDRPDVREALQRGEREWQLDRAVQRAVEQYHPDLSELDAQMSVLRRQLHEPAAVTGGWFLYSTEAHATAALDHYRVSSDASTAVETDSLPRVEMFEVTWSSQVCDLMLGSGRFDELRELAAGQVMSTGESAWGFSFFRKTSFREDAAIDSPRLEQLALKVLRRGYADELVSEILGTEETL